MNSTAHPTSSSAAFITSATPALELKEARQARDGLARLLRAEHDAMADFLIALADFDRRRGWERLGHASLFAFLHVDLKLPNPSAFWRQSAARALQRFPGLVEPLRDGRLCCTSTAELAKVLTEENWDEVLPRFFGLSSRQAQEVVAELQPRQAPATRMVVTRVEQVAVARSPANDQQLPPAGSPGESLFLAGARGLDPASVTLAIPEQLHPDVVPPSQLRAPEVDFGGGARSVARRDDIEPLTADLLLEKQARARGQVKRPRSVAAAATRFASMESMANQEAIPTANQSAPRAERPVEHSLEHPISRLHRRTGPRETIPAAVKRAVWERDRGRSTWPLDSGGCCTSTHRLQLDHLVPWARGGPPTVDGLRLLCSRHNLVAARQAFGNRCVERYAGARPGA